MGIHQAGNGQHSMTVDDIVVPKVATDLGDPVSLN
jgi:hypothetical protein